MCPRARQSHTQGIIHSHSHCTYRLESLVSAFFSSLLSVEFEGEAKACLGTLLKTMILGLKIDLGINKVCSMVIIKGFLKNQ